MSEGEQIKTRHARLGRVPAVAEDALAELRRMPTAVHVGLIVIAAGIAFDLVAHLALDVQHDHGEMTGSEVTAHVVVFVGMVMTLAGVALSGLRSSRGNQTTTRRHSDAVR